MFEYFGHLYQSISRFVDDWSHKMTAGLGLGFAIAPAVDLATRLLGAMAIVVSIYCSFRRDRREERQARLDEELKRAAGRAKPHLTVFPPDGA